MNARRLGAALIGLLVMSAITAGNASASATTEPAQWYVNSSLLTGSQAATASLEGVGVLETEVGETPLTLEWTGLECVSCTIFNEGSGAKGSGKLKFTGVTVATPSGCEVVGGTILTTSLAIDATYMNGSTWAQLWAPASGTQLTTVTLQKKPTKTCPIAGPYIVRASMFSAAANATGVNSTLQLFQFSPTINSTLGGFVTFGSKPATVTFGLKLSIFTNLLNAH